MSDKKVLMHVTAEGSATIEAEGYEGESCLAATQPFENLFGKEDGDREMVGAGGPAPTHGESVV